MLDGNISPTGCIRIAAASTSSMLPEAQESGGTGKAQSRNPVAYAGEKSDTFVVPKTPSNKGDDPAEMVAGRNVAKGNVNENPAPRTPSRNKVASMGLEGVRIAATKDKELRFTALLHHITPTLLVESFYALRHDAAAGVDAPRLQREQIAFKQTPYALTV